jgi:hypothetical protein
MKKLPIGIQSFPQLIGEGYCYVDKTPLIHRLTEQGKYYFLSRPRRFGKSLLISTLKAAFRGRQEWFQGLYLERNWDWSIVRPVIHLSLGGGVVQGREELELRLNELLSRNAEEYRVELRNPTTAGRFAELIRRLREQSGHSVAVLVDEYDKPILDNLERPEAALAIRDGLRNLYSVIKDSGEDIHFALLTGVSKFSKVSLFSGLNNLEDITLSAEFATLCGYTEAEIRATFADYLDGVNFEQLRAWYNGYNFLGEKVYNPFDVLLYLKHREFGNYWFETGSPSFLIDLLQRRRFPIPDLERLQAGEELLGSFDVGRIELEALLFQTGYLTIKERRRLGSRVTYELTYPNREVKMSLTDRILSVLVAPSGDKERNQNAVYLALEQGRPADLQGLFHAFFASIPHDWYRKNQLAGYEGYYASVVYCYFTALGLEVRAEDSTNLGRLDLAVRLDDKVYLIEFKVVELAGEAGGALEQIKARRYAEKYQGAGREIYLLGVEFSRDTRNIVAFAWERA